jgi:hypothetical protein
MDILKTWLQIGAVFALCFVTLGWYQSRQTLTLREAEIARLKVRTPELQPTASETTPSRAPAAVSSPQASEPPADTTMLADNSADFAALYAERDRYKEGLEKCVSEVNRLAQSSGRRLEMPALPTSGTPSGGSQDQPHISALYSEPTVVPLGDRLQVSGKLFNTGKVPGTATAVISILRDGKPVMTARETVTVPAQGQAAWSHTFPWSGQEGAWTATVRVE